MANKIKKEDREEFIIHSRFEIIPPITFREIAENLGITRQRVHQIYKRSLKENLKKIKEVKGEDGISNGNKGL